MRFIELLQSTIDDLKHKLQTQEQKTAIVQETLNGKLSEIMAKQRLLTDKLRFKSSQVDKQKEEIVRLESEAQRHVKETENWQQTKIDYEHRLQSKDAQIVELEKKIQSAYMKYALVVKKNEELLSKITNFRTLQNGITGEVEKYKLLFDGYEQSNLDLKTKIDRKEKKIKKLNLQIEVSNKMAKETEIKMRELSSVLAAKERQIELLETKIHDFEKQNCKISELLSAQLQQSDSRKMHSLAMTWSDASKPLNDRIKTLTTLLS